MKQGGGILLVICLLGGLVVAGLAPGLAAGLATNLDWWTVDGGGGEGHGGSYILDASIGQADAGTLRGGSYTLAGGFWSAGPSALVESEYRLALPLVMK